MDKLCSLSVVAPLRNEEESLPIFVSAVRSALEAYHDWELILVDDGSDDRTASVAAGIAQRDPRVRLIRLARHYGQTTALQAGFSHASGDVVVSIDGDLQNDPRDIPALVDKLHEGFDLVAGYREGRVDKPLSRRLPSRVANLLIMGVTHVPIHDSGCTLKAFRRELLDRLRLYSDMHRFIPAMAAGVAGARIAEIPVRHHPRRFGTSKYGISRVGKVLGDLIVVKMIQSFRERPLAFFGLPAVGAAVLGLMFTVAALVALASFRPEKANALVLPGAAMLWFVLALYLVMLGLLGELIVRWQYRSLDSRQPLVEEEPR